MQMAPLETLTIGDNRLCRVHEMERQKIFSRVGELLRVSDGVAIYAVEDLVQMFVPALGVKYMLDLVGTELYVFENCLIGMKRTKNAIVA